ncbi:hypothetical protein ACTI_57450 [Actinoplanes sp. OR16]|uniref:hypothetical protein n=1 Tax=Actinoplanes sp. OR16 TaxID=946334 RepID=UPI000F6DC239|nr:hypothetical protein [Actinoplanes sp. OR16]BBH69060.1 hypothetical protein ACTI_57450 [Actinoplanes sp. OR16]
MPRILGWAAAAALIALIVLTFGPLPGWILDGNHPEAGTLPLTPRLAAEKDLRLLLLQAIAGLLLIAGAFATWRQVSVASGQLAIARSTRVTTAFTSALDQLGADSAARRIGGVYALDRMMETDPGEIPRILPVLAAFVRQDPAVPLRPVTADVEAAVLICLARRGDTPLSFAGAKLRGLDLTVHDLRGIDLTDTVF